MLGHVVDSYVRFVIGHDLERAISIAEIRTETAKNKTLPFLSSLIQSGTWFADGNIKPFHLMCYELSVYDGMILRGNCIVIPATLQKRVLKLAHRSHVGIVRTNRILGKNIIMELFDFLKNQSLKVDLQFLPFRTICLILLTFFETLF